MAQVTQVIGWSSFSGSEPVHSGEYVSRSEAVIFGHSTSVGARRHLPSSEQALYFFALTSYKSMHTESTDTLCGGFSLSAASFKSEPMKNCPAGICTISAGQVTAAGAAAEATVGATADATTAVGAFDPVFLASPSPCLPPSSSTA